MGDIYEFKCGSCNYKAQVSDGRDRGFQWESKTVLCRNCQELGSASTSLASLWDDEEPPSESETKQSTNLFEQLASTMPDDLFEGSGSTDDVDEESDGDIDAESLFGYFLDVRNCKKKNHLLVDWPIGGRYECPKCAQPMVRGEVVMNID